MIAKKVEIYLAEMQKAASLVNAHIANLNSEDFHSNIMAQQAVAMNLIIIGEAANRIHVQFPDFIYNNSQIPWQEIRGMRNRLAHGYFEINQNIVWDTAKFFVPILLQSLEKLVRE